MKDYIFLSGESILMKRVQQLAKKLNREELERLHSFAKEVMPWTKDLYFERTEFKDPDRNLFRGLDFCLVITKDTQPEPVPLKPEEMELLSKIQDSDISAILKMLANLSKEELQAICEGKEIKNSIIGTFDFKLIMACISCLSKL